MGIGPWKDTLCPELNNYLQTPTDLVARAHAHDLQVLVLHEPYPVVNFNKVTRYAMSHQYS